MIVKKTELLQSSTRSITKWDILLLLQKGTTVITKWDGFFCYKVGQFYYKVGQFYYKVVHNRFSSQ